MLQVIEGGIDIWLAPWLPGKPVEEYLPGASPEEGQPCVGDTGTGQAGLRR